MQLLECGLQRVRRLGAEGTRFGRNGARSGAGEGWGVRRYNRPRSILEEGANPLMDSQTVRQKHKDFLFPCVANYYAEPVVITEAHGSNVKDLDGHEYLDFFGGILTAGIGHSHPEFVKRIQDQVARLVHTSSVYPTQEQVRVAERLTQITPGKLKKSFEIAVGIIRKYGAVFICDEVQTGWGRTGDKWCGIEHWGVEPEIMTFAKSIANGFPVGATIATEQVANAFTGLTLSTFGGNAISMAAVDVTMEVMERENTPQRSAVRGAQLRDALEEFKKRFAFIGDVRGMGLMQGIELVEDRKTKEPSAKKTLALLEAAKRHGLLIGKGGLYGNVIRIAPSMLISKAEVDDGCARLERALAEVK